MTDSTVVKQPLYWFTSTSDSSPSVADPLKTRQGSAFINEIATSWTNPWSLEFDSPYIQHFYQSFVDHSVRSKSPVPESSAESLPELARERYTKIAGQLAQLSEWGDDEAEVEHAAIDSAQRVISGLQRCNYAPPALSWHGGDAIVLLWSIAEASIAITITDGELGYIVRRDRKTVKMADSIPVDSNLRLEDIR